LRYPADGVQLSVIAKNSKSQMKLTPMKIKFLLLCIFLSGCSTAKLISSWRAPNEKVPASPNIAVLALLPDRDLAARRQIEDRMVDALCSSGIYSVSALSEYGKDAFCDGCKADILMRLKRSDINAIVTISLVRTVEKTSGSAVRFYDHQLQASVAAKSRRNVSGDAYYWETNIYRLDNQKLLYSARTQTSEPVSYGQFCDQGIPLVIEDMSATLFGFPVSDTN